MRPLSLAALSLSLLHRQCMPQQRTMNRNFRLHVSETPSFRPVRRQRQRSLAQWRPWWRKARQVLAKSRSPAFRSGAVAANAGACKASRHKGCEALGARSQARDHSMIKRAQLSWCAYHLRSPQRHHPAEPSVGDILPGAAARQGTPPSTPYPSPPACYVHTKFVRASANRSETQSG